MTNTVKQLITLSHYAGARLDYTQGGGGNTSVKNDSGEMFIKASGFRLKDMTETSGYVPLDYKRITAFLDKVDVNDISASESVGNAEIKASILKKEGLPEARPSVEAGFHAALKRVVCHTHSIYANILTCAKDVDALCEKVFENCGFEYAVVPYVDPGFTLSVKMNELVKNSERYPEVIFMRNHGLVVSGDTVEGVIALNDKVNDLIRKYFGITEAYDCAVLEKRGEDDYLSKTPFNVRFARVKDITLDMLDRYPLYPDQLVYLNNLLRNTPEKLNVSGGAITYKTTEKEAYTLDETLFAYLFVISALTENNLEISVMNEKDVSFINNWEAEKYRRSLSK